MVTFERRSQGQQGGADAFERAGSSLKGACQSTSWLMQRSNSAWWRSYEPATSVRLPLSLEKTELTSFAGAAASPSKHTGSSPAPGSSSATDPPSSLLSHGSRRSDSASLAGSPSPRRCEGVRRRTWAFGERIRQSLVREHGGMEWRKSRWKGRRGVLHREGIAVERIPEGVLRKRLEPDSSLSSLFCSQLILLSVQTAATACQLLALHPIAKVNTLKKTQIGQAQAMSAFRGKSWSSSILLFCHRPLTQPQPCPAAPP